MSDGRTLLAVDTSVAVPLLVGDHAEHRSVVRWWGRRALHLAGHAAVETYSVLTRLPGDLRLSGADAAELIDRRFTSVLALSATSEADLPRHLAGLGVVGGAVYDALVAMAAIEHGAVLATRDLRARDTYERVGAAIEIAV